MRRTTIKDVASQAGVSIGTVSAVLNGRDSVNSLTKVRVLEVIEELNYRPVEAARRRLGTPREKTLGFVVKEIHNPYFADIIVGAQEEALRRGYRLIVMSSEKIFEHEVDAIRVLVEKDIDALIINPLLAADGRTDQFDRLIANNIPFVMIEGLTDGPRASTVDIDNERGAATATRYLLDSGHQKIAHLEGPAYSQHAVERRAGVLSEAPEAIIFPAGATLKEGYHAVLELLKIEQPDAILCYNDLVAIGAMRGLGELELRVPEDVSVVGFDDIEISSFLSVPLTTVGVPRREIGRQAAAIAVHEIEGPRGTPPERVLLEAELVMRASTTNRR